MKVCSRIQQGLVVLVTATSLLGSQVLLSAAQVSTSAQAVDVALSATATLSGAVVDTRGHARGKTAVEVRRGRRLVARALTDANGRYDVSNLPGGLYQVRVDGTETLVRAWAAGTAPRSAAKQLPVIADAPIVRGQDQDAPPAAAAEPASRGLFGGSALADGLVSALIVGGVVGTILIIDAIDDHHHDEPAPASP
ncbi:MAG: carboxypeptidase-like regulatory domain-containing protein [Planctomycetota bacterium]|nr:carboxypeptidase-like regulatory domain-containing protein [Planctomycetota bacterium]